MTSFPDQTLLVSDPGKGDEHIRALHDAEGRYAFVYLPTTRPVTIGLDVMADETAQGLAVRSTNR
jgi:hypothetical protein